MTAAIERLIITGSWVAWATGGRYNAARLSGDYVIIKYMGN